MIAQENSIDQISYSLRHFLLTNGSLLIVNSRISDSGKYRCNATNHFAKKLFRISISMLNVMSRSDDNDNHGSRLLPQLQSSIQKIKSGQNLILHCASQTNKVREQKSSRINKRATFFYIPFFFLLLFFTSRTKISHRFYGHSHHVPATSQSTFPSSTMS